MHLDRRNIETWFIQKTKRRDEMDSGNYSDGKDSADSKICLTVHLPENAPTCPRTTNGEGAPYDVIRLERVRMRLWLSHLVQQKLSSLDSNSGSVAHVRHILRVETRVHFIPFEWTCCFLWEGVDYETTNGHKVDKNFVILLWLKELRR